MKRAILPFFCTFIILSNVKYSTAQIIQIIPKADTIWFGGGCSPGSLGWTLLRTKSPIDTIAVQGGSVGGNHNIATVDFDGKMHFYERISILAQDTAHNLTYEVYKYERIGSAYNWIQMLPDQYDMFLSEYLRVLVFRNSIPVDSIVQFIRGYGGLSVDPTANAASFQLDQNFPNPFHEATTISFSLQKYQYVILRIYDIYGNLITTFISGELPPGVYSYDWNPTGLANGIYFCQLAVNGTIKTKKLQLLK